LDNKDKIIKFLINRLSKVDCDLCSLCKNIIACEEKKCEKYISGIGDAEGKYPEWKWSCMDFDFGECPLMENTPCNGCIQNDSGGFEFDESKLTN
jgi:hypothetical protein